MIEPTDVTAIVEAIKAVHATLCVIGTTIVVLILGHALLTKK